MANNFANIMPKILARALMGLRERAGMPRLVNSDYSTDAARKGTTIDIPVPTAVSVMDVTPSVTDDNPADATPDLVQVALNNWKKNVPFYMTDKELAEIDRNEHFLPMQAAEAVRSLARAVNQDIFDEYKGVYGYFGTAGATPFATTVQGATQVRAILNKQLCPPDRRVGMLNFDAEAAMLELATFSDSDRVGDTNDPNRVKVTGEIGRKFGVDWYADDDVPLHTAGTITTGLISKAATAYAIGVKTISATTAASTGACALVIGDIITFAGDAQTYVLTAAATQATAATDVTLTFYPGLKVAHVGSEAVTVKATHRVNLVFHPDAFAFATRPLADATAGLPTRGQIMTMQDPKTGLVLRLEVKRQNKQVVWEFDILWGAKLVRPEFACRLAG